jgi:hypothetical protein
MRSSHSSSLYCSKYFSYTNRFSYFCLALWYIHGYLINFCIFQSNFHLFHVVSCLYIFMYRLFLFMDKDLICVIFKIFWSWMFCPVFIFFIQILIQSFRFYLFYFQFFLCMAFFSDQLCVRWLFFLIKLCPQFPPVVTAAESPTSRFVVLWSLSYSVVSQCVTDI